MADWTGFTDEELRKLKRQSSKPNDGPGLRQVRNGPTVRGPPPGRGRGTNREAWMSSASTTKKPSNPQPITASQMLAPPKTKPPEETVTKSTTQSGTKSNGHPQEGKTKDLSKSSPDGNEKPELPKEKPAKEVKEVDEKQFLQKQLSTVETFQYQQKLMEEQNKRKKQMLFSAITERQNKAKSEAVKLSRIQRELAQLDQLLSVDVSIIRDRIEEASREFLDAQKRYERAEKEFVESKIELHNKSDLKDQLTEHLYTIIHQNEVRKAKKLTELMEKLDMENDGECEEVAIELTTPPTMTPQALLLGENTMAHTRHPVGTNAHSAPPTSPVTSAPTVGTTLPGAVGSDKDSVPQDNENTTNSLPSDTTAAAIVTTSTTTAGATIATTDKAVTSSIQSSSSSSSSSPSTTLNVPSTSKDSSHPPASKSSESHTCESGSMSEITAPSQTGCESIKDKPKDPNGNVTSDTAGTPVL